MKKLFFKPKPIMLFGTSSGVGKSLMSAALCRVLLRRGENPYPFKGQNMSNNAWVDEKGGEMAFSQAMQSWSAGLTPSCLMNPILLKPKGDSTSEVIHLGKMVGIAKAEKYYDDWFDSGWDSILRSLKHLHQLNQSNRLIIEGAGSPVEVNLQKRDLTNLRIAKMLQANCLLIADIERGGVFAQLVGTLSLMKPKERKLIRGILINRFRGRRELFEDGKIWLEKKTGIPVLGIMPWLNEVFPPEDSLDLLESKVTKKNAEIEIVVIRLPTISNFSDLDPLQSEETVNLRWVEIGQTIGMPDALIIPGSKQTISDLSKLFSSGLSDQIIDYANKGGNILGICGGMQMLGRTLEDPIGVEGNKKNQTSSIVNGLNLLPIHTKFVIEKKLIQQQITVNWPEKVPVIGFELHHGMSRLVDETNQLVSLEENTSIGWALNKSIDSSSIVGTYLHGILDNGDWRRLWLNKIRVCKGLKKLPLNQPHHSSQIDKMINLLADAFEQYVDITPLINE